MSDELNINFNHMKNYFSFLKIIFFIICTSITKEKQRNILIYSSEIHMIINGNGTQILLTIHFILPLLKFT